MITMLDGHSTLMMVISGERWIGTMPPAFGSPRTPSTAFGSATARATTSRTLRALSAPSNAARQSAMKRSLSNMIAPLVQPSHVRRAFTWQVAHAVLHDEGEARPVLQHADVRERIAVDRQQVGKIARCDGTRMR